MSFLLERDALSGKAGRAFATIDGRNVEMFGIKKFQADPDRLCNYLLWYTRVS